MQVSNPWPLEPLEGTASRVARLWVHRYTICLLESYPLRWVCADRSPTMKTFLHFDGQSVAACWIFLRRTVEVSTQDDQDVMARRLRHHSVVFIYFGKQKSPTYDIECM